ncbi:uncharacterized protein LOC120561144 [Perca fluviatilis]|uniref:uncharacterized protein LOC120561144 n=1 Tax=Perca fluviatilis TaxID=8168 RepID=UPI00196493ED|nr:uncharacterized protein LOC120561144 [Perca fluviatilis]
MYMRMRTRSRSNLSPYEILFARPPYVRTEMPKAAIPSTALCEHDMLKYCTQLSSALSDIRKQVSTGLPKPAEGPLHKLRPGDFVVIKSFRRKNWQSRRWEGPFQILLVTHTAVKVAERSTWVHVPSEEIRGVQIYTLGTLVREHGRGKRVTRSTVSASRSRWRSEYNSDSFHPLHLQLPVREITFSEAVLIQFNFSRGGCGVIHCFERCPLTVSSPSQPCMAVKKRIS